HRVSLGQHLEDLAFARGERGEARQAVGRLDARAEIIHQLREHAWAQIAAAPADVANRGDQLRRWAVFEDIAAGAYFHAFHQVVFIVVHGEKQDLGFGPILLDLLRGFEAAEARHADVHQHDVRTQ